LNISAQRLQLELQQHMQQGSRSAPASPGTASGTAAAPPTAADRGRHSRGRWRGTFRIRKLSNCKQS